MMSAIELPDIAPGHWDTPAGRDMAMNYVDKPREWGSVALSDLALANRVFMADRNDLDLIVWQGAAKERIRWLSAQLIIAQQKAAHLQAQVDEAFALAEAAPELNMSNYDHDQVAELNAAMIDVWAILQGVKS